MDNEHRIQALHQLKNAGVRTGALLCPVIPYITDAAELIDLLAPCTDVIWIYGLNTNDRSDKSWLNVKAILNREFPELLEQIEAAVFSKEDLFWAQLGNDLEKLKHDRQLNLNIRL